MTERETGRCMDKEKNKDTNRHITQKVTRLKDKHVK